LLLLEAAAAMLGFPPFCFPAGVMAARAFWLSTCPHGLKAMNGCLLPPHGCRVMGHIQGLGKSWLL
jgi:hypothetical protein